MEHLIVSCCHYSNFVVGRWLMATQVVARRAGSLTKSGVPGLITC